MIKNILPAILLCSSMFWSCDSPLSSGDDNTITPTALEGTWTGFEKGGDGKIIKWVVTNNSMTEYEDDILTYKGTFILDESVNPKHIDITITECPYTAYIGQVSLGIFKIESDQLSLCANEPGNSMRPSTFTNTGNSRWFVFSKG